MIGDLGIGLEFRAGTIGDESASCFLILIPTLIP